MEEAERRNCATYIIVGQEYPIHRALYPPPIPSSAATVKWFEEMISRLRLAILSTLPSTLIEGQKARVEYREWSNNKASQSQAPAA